MLSELLTFYLNAYYSPADTFLIVMLITKLIAKATFLMLSLKAG